MTFINFIYDGDSEKTHQHHIYKNVLTRMISVKVR